MRMKQVAKKESKQRNTAVSCAFWMQLSWWARVSRVGTHLWCGRIRRPWGQNGVGGWVGESFLSLASSSRGWCPELQEWDVGRMRVQRVSRLPVSRLQNLSCHDLACDLYPHWPYIQLSHPSAYPSLCLFTDVWNFWQWPSFPCNYYTLVIGSGKFCFENHFLIRFSS